MKDDFDDLLDDNTDNLEETIRDKKREGECFTFGISDLSGKEDCQVSNGDVLSDESVANNAADEVAEGITDSEVVEFVEPKMARTLDIENEQKSTDRWDLSDDAKMEQRIGEDDSADAGVGVDSNSVGNDVADDDVNDSVGGIFNPTETEMQNEPVLGLYNESEIESDAESKGEAKLDDAIGRKESHKDAKRENEPEFEDVFEVKYDEDDAENQGGSVEFIEPEIAKVLEMPPASESEKDKEHYEEEREAEETCVEVDNQLVADSLSEKSEEALVAGYKTDSVSASTEVSPEIDSEAAKVEETPKLCESATEIEAGPESGDDTSAEGVVDEEAEADNYEKTNFGDAVSAEDNTKRDREANAEDVVDEEAVTKTEAKSDVEEAFDADTNAEIEGESNVEEAVDEEAVTKTEAKSNVEDAFDADTNAEIENESNIEEAVDEGAVTEIEAESHVDEAVVASGANESTDGINVASAPEVVAVAKPDKKPSQNKGQESVSEIKVKDAAISTKTPKNEIRAERKSEVVKNVVVEETPEVSTENEGEAIAAESPQSKPSRTKKPMEQTINSESNESDSDGIILKSISKVMHESMIPYSEFVIMDRALPRVEDGLKPVQRRILYAMHDMGLEPDKPFRKSAGIVGECLGKYHPHGDTSVYDAMVRLAQPFNLNMPLVIGQGNFGSEDGDPPAAMRYTEAKLGHLALELLRDIEKETVPFSLTFDDRNTEPDILPGRYPNLLVNGATGIAVGLATNIAPHNLAEVIDAHVAYIDNPKITLQQVMKIIKGPDFPTGGFVICGEDLQTAYRTGKGKVIMRAKIHIEVEGNDRRNIVITELPYQVNKVTLQKNIADLRENKKGVLSGISEIRDESDRKGMRVVIKVKRESDPRAICDMLFKYTNLQCNFNINMVAIADGKPKLMGLMDLIVYYVNYQREVIYKRCVYDLEQAKERAHILEGLLIAIRNIDEVVRIIKTSKHTTEARQRLRDTFELSERQAQAILDLRLARLTSLEVYKLEEELKELLKLIAELEKIIASKQLQLGVVKQELLEIKRKHKIDRRSRIIASIEDAVITADDDEKPVEDVVVTLTAEGTIKRMPVKHFSMSKTEALGGLGLHDINTVVVQTQTDKLLYIFTNHGNCYKLDAGDVPECKLRDKGTTFKTIFNAASDGEIPVAVYAFPPEYLPSPATESVPSDGNSVKLSPELVWLTRLGMIKRSSWTESCAVVKSMFQCYKSARGDDSVLRVDEFKPGCTVMLISSQGYVLNAQTGDVPLQGRIAGGVKGISMSEDDFVVCNVVAKRSGFIVAVTNKGNVKKTPVKDIDRMVRYRKGLMLGNLDKDEKLVFACVVKGDEDLVAQLENGTVVFTPVDKIPQTDRTGKYKSFPGSKGKIKAAWIHRRKRNN